MPKKEKKRTAVQRNKERKRLQKIFANVNSMSKEKYKPSDELRDLMRIQDGEAIYGYFKKKYLWFYKEAPNLFDMVLDPEMDQETFNKLFSKMYVASNQVNEGLVTKGEVEPNIGEVLKEEYIDPLMDQMEEIAPDQPRVLVNNKEVSITTDELEEKLKEQNNTQ